MKFRTRKLNFLPNFRRIVFIVVGVIILCTAAIYMVNRQINYCSMLNGCPSDKCVIQMGCAGGASEPIGCTPGPRWCEFKDPKLKTAYTEISMEQTAQCVQKFLDKNANEYDVFSDMEIDYERSKDKVDTCGSDKKDKYCRFIILKHKFDKNFGYVTEFFVGAQTCSVYWDVPPDPSGFKKY